MEIIKKGGEKDVFKPIALIYPEEVKSPLFIGYSQEKESSYTVHTSFGAVKRGLLSLKEVHDCIEREFGTNPAFKWMPLFNIDSLVM